MNFGDFTLIQENARDSSKYGQKFTIHKWRYKCKPNELNHWVTFRNKKINFEIRNIFRKGSKKFRRKKFIFEVNIFTPEYNNSFRSWRFSLRSKNINFKVENFWLTEFLRYNSISRSNRLRGIQKTCSRDHRKWKSRNNHYAS